MPTASIDIRLPDPVPQRLLGNAEIPGDLADRPAALADQLDSLATELLRVRGTGLRHGHHILSAGSDSPKRSDVHKTGGTPHRLKQLTRDPEPNLSLKLRSPRPQHPKPTPHRTRPHRRQQLTLPNPSRTQHHNHRPGSSTHPIKPPLHSRQLHLALKQPANSNPRQHTHQPPPPGATPTPPHARPPGQIPKHTNTA